MAPKEKRRGPAHRRRAGGVPGLRDDASSRDPGTAALPALCLRSRRARQASPLRDRVDGGFFRYATRADWSEPHYERMLTDNSLLLDVAVDLTSAEPDADRLRSIAQRANASSKARLIAK